MYTYMQMTSRNLRRTSLDREAKEGAKKLRELLADPVEFERWAKETLDMSRMRRR